MSKFAIGEQVDNAADNHEGGMVIAVFPTVDGNFRYAVDMEGYGALKPSSPQPRRQSFGSLRRSARGNYRGRFVLQFAQSVDLALERIRGTRIFLSQNHA